MPSLSRSFFARLSRKALSSSSGFPIRWVSIWTWLVGAIAAGTWTDPLGRYSALPWRTCSTSRGLSSARRSLSSRHFPSVLTKVQRCRLRACYFSRWVRLSGSGWSALRWWSSLSSPHMMHFSRWVSWGPITFHRWSWSIFRRWWSLTTGWLGWTMLLTGFVVS